MSSNPSFNAPVLNYIGSVDVASATSGSTLYNIVFDSSLSTIGNILMFEYKIQPINVLNPDPGTITLGYVNVENAIFNSGITNQWTIAIPATNNIYNPPIDQEISVRVYSGLTGTSEIAVSLWSNPLAVHVPPPQPEIYNAYFDQNDLYLDDLWINMNVNTEYNYNDISFIVAYYFQDATSGSTIWAVSDPLNATDVVIGNTAYKQLAVSDIGNVAPYQNVVYTAVYAVYPFSHNNNNYYSVSEISATYNAEPANQYTDPTITTINYNVYNVPSNQTMTVNWLPPQSSSVPNFQINKYILEVSTNSGVSWTVIDNNISSTTLSYDVDVSSYTCGTTLSFRVTAVFNSGTETYSNVESLNIFKYSLAPQNLSVVSSAPLSGNLVNVTISFQNPTNIGCGSGYQYVIDFLDVSGVIQTTRYRIYDASAVTYTLPYTGLNIPSNGSIRVYLETTDTNQPSSGPTVYRDGTSTQTPYIVSSVALNPIDYLVYTTGEQKMILTWNNPTAGLTGWSVTSYKVYLGTTVIATITNGATTYTYDSSLQPCGATLVFKVDADLQNGSTAFTIVSNSQSCSIFKYSLAPQNLSVVSSAPSLGNLANVTISFQNPTSIGCGSGYQYVIEFLNTSNIVQTTRYESYNASAVTYTLPYTGLNIPSNGSIRVYLQTSDTNQPSSGPTVYRDGASTQTPYIVSSVTLNPVDYLVYTTGEQKMILTWNNPTAGLTGWSVTSYKVYLGTTVIATITNGATTYTYDSSLQPCGATLVFKVEADLQNGSTAFTIVSNTSSINIFRYADAPQSVVVDWASSDINNTMLDILSTFIVPSNYNPGCGSIIEWVAEVYDSSNAIINSATQRIQYIPNRTVYPVYFTNVPFTTNGYVRVFLQTIDTNGRGTMDGAYASGSFISEGLPIFADVNINSNRTQLTFNVVSMSALTRISRFVWFDIGSRSNLPFDTINIPVTPGLTVVTTQTAGNVISYDFTVTPEFFSLTNIPSNLSILVSNRVGIAIDNVPN